MTANTGAATADKSSKLNHSLRKHRRTHQNNYKDNCTHCPKLFPGKDHLVLHGRLHDSDNTDTNPCPRVQSEVQNKKTLTGHLKTHSTDKPHKCDSCDSAFTRKSNLTRHVLAAHTGPVFHCDICLAPFELNQRLKAKSPGSRPQLKCHRATWPYGIQGYNDANGDNYGVNNANVDNDAIISAMP